MKHFLTLILFFASFSICNSQTIETEKIFGGYKFSQNGRQLSMGDLNAIFEPNSASAELLKKARRDNTFATILGGAGGGLVGYTLGTALGGGEPNWAIAGIGAGIIAVAIPISYSAGKKAREAVELYNTRTNSKEAIVAAPQFNLTANATGIGFSLVF